MEPDVIRFGGGGDTSVSIFVIGIVVAVMMLMFILPRRYVIFPFLLSALLLPLSQRIVVAGLHFMMLRVILICAWLRMLPELTQALKSKSPSAKKMDRMVLFWGFCGTVTFTLLYLNVDALVNRMGYLVFSMVGSYFLLRVMVRDEEDVRLATRAMVWVAVGVAIMTTYERFTGHGVWENNLEIREGKVRAQGPFLHSLLAGTFGGTVLPLFAMFWRKGSKFLAATGIASAVVIIYLSSTSTAILTGGAGILALALWPLRSRMRNVRWSIVAILCGLQLVMKAPVWALIARIDLTGGSSSYHRYMLVDQFIWRFFDWWLVGVKSTSNWGWDLWDTSNFYVEWGITGGLATFATLIAILVYGFQAIGVRRKIAEQNGDDQWGIWCVGAALFAHAVGFVGTSYFDQSIVGWMVILAMIAALSNESPVGTPTSAAARVSRGVRPVTRPLRGLSPDSPYARRGRAGAM